MTKRKICPKLRTDVGAPRRKTDQDSTTNHLYIINGQRNTCCA